MPFAVYLLKAHNSQDFDKEDYFIAGETEEASRHAFEACLKDDWEKADEDDIEFYETYEKWEEAWTVEIDILPLHPLPKSEEKI